jgi:hypothetical protein
VLLERQGTPSMACSRWSTTLPFAAYYTHPSVACARSAANAAT